MITLVSSNPVANQINVSPGIELFFAFQDSLNPIIYTKILINGTTVFTFDVSMDANYPDFYVKTTAINNFRSYSFKPRIQFNFGEQILVSYDVRTSGSNLTGELKFYIVEESPNLFQLETKYPDPIAEMYRQFILGLSEQKAPSFVTQLYRLVLDSSLSFLTTDFRLPLTIKIDAEGLPKPQIPLFRRGYSTLETVAPFWAIFLNLLLRQGVPPSYLDLLDKHFRSDYPENKIGSIAAALLFYNAIL